MTTIEIHAGHREQAGDWFAKVVGVMVAIIGVVLAMVTIASHRAHTAAVIYRTEANDQWASYQAEKVRENIMDAVASLASLVSTDDREKARDLAQQLTQRRERYSQDAEDTQRDAHEREALSEREEHRALRLDLGEGLLELGLVMSSLYFLSRQRLFPIAGVMAALIGAAVAASNWLV